jgi:sulfur carrier protein
MTIILNGEPQDVRAVSLEEVLAEIGLSEAIVATALNGTFVAARARKDTKVNDGDRLEVVAPRQGG